MKLINMYFISFLVVCKIAFCSEFPDIADIAGRKTRRRRTQATAKRSAFYANAISKVCYEETGKNGNKHVAFVPRNSCSKIFVNF